MNNGTVVARVVPIAGRAGEAALSRLEEFGRDPGFMQRLETGYRTALQEGSNGYPAIKVEDALQALDLVVRRQCRVASSKATDRKALDHALSAMPTFKSIPRGGLVHELVTIYVVELFGAIPGSFRTLDQALDHLRMFAMAVRVVLPKSVSSEQGRSGRYLRNGLA